MPAETTPPDQIRGQSEAEAQTRLKAEGFNELPRPDQRTPLRIVLEVIREPMLALLLGAGAIYLVLGDLAEALILIAFATFFSASPITALIRPNGALVRVLLAVAAMLATTLLWPWATALLRFGPLHAKDLALAVSAGVVLFLVLEFAKPLWRRLRVARAVPVVASAHQGRKAGRSGRDLRLSFPRR